MDKTEKTSSPEVKLADFLAEIRLNPDFKPSEPADSLGDSYAVWSRPWTEKRACLEYSLDGILYFEVLDMSQANGGKLIGIDSKLREVVLAYVKLTPENLAELAARVRSKLEETFAKLEARREEEIEA